MASSCSPSSSAVTIPIPGKSILKKPPPAPQSIFSRISRFLPTQAQPQPVPAEGSKPLKRAHFILPQIATVYPISSINPPSTPTLKDEKKAIEDREAERRKRVVRGNSLGPEETEEWWSLEKVDSFYRECCESADEEPDPGISASFKRASGANPRAVDLSGVQLTRASAGILSDVFTIEWGLRKLVLRECDLDEQTLRPILHSLLIPGSLSFLSVASNRRLKANAYRLVGAFMAKSENLQFLDLSQNALDKKSIEYITSSLATAPNQGLVSLRLDDCSLRSAVLEVLARAVRTSSLRNISLRHNRITATGAVALALMIRDYPDVVPATPPASVPPSPASSVMSLSPPGTPTTPTSSMMSNFSHPPANNSRTGPILPPPRHPSTAPQTTYTPYIPRKSRRAHQPTPLPLSPTGQPVPLITSSLQGGVTTRHALPSPLAPGNDPAADAGLRHAAGPSAALLDKVRALDALPRLGALRTLDLKGNDLRAGITYIAQVLKRNRTLKVLNLTENKLDVPCLVAIAEALKYNSSLETLDLSKNPCSGPGLEGIQSLRTAFTLNTALKRLFLSSTSMTSAGAIALAEFLPESTSLLHLDLTMNELDIAGVMALSSGLKANHTMRCLDLNIPPGDEEFARMCRDILNSCVRNTEEAEKNSQMTSPMGESGRGLGKGVWGMIEESKLAKTIRKGEKEMMSPDIVQQSRACVEEIKGALSDPAHAPDLSSIAAKAKTLILELTKTIETTNDPVRLEELLQANDELLSYSDHVPEPARPTLKLHGLGLDLGDDQSLTPNNGNATGDALSAAFVNGNGQVFHDSPVEDPHEDEPTTPRVDKGKARAEPEPEEQEKVLSANFLINESESEDEDGSRSIVVPGDFNERPSPTDRSKSWVEEEGEVFRKGTQLLRPEDFEADYAGEDLRKELLEAMVERPPPRPFIDEFGMETGNTEQEAPAPIVSSEEPKKPPPRPYIARSRSSSSSSLVSSLLSPTSPSSVPSDESAVTTPTLASKTPSSPASPLASGRTYVVRRPST